MFISLLRKGKINMSKKYAPSGYQIINLDFSDKTSNVGFVPETEDEKLVMDILKNEHYNKPILISLKTPQITHATGFALLIDGGIKIQTDSMVEDISVSGDKIIWVETEI